MGAHYTHICGVDGDNTRCTAPYGHKANWRVQSRPGFILIQRVTGRGSVVRLVSPRFSRREVTKNISILSSVWGSFAVPLMPKIRALCPVGGADFQLGTQAMHVFLIGGAK